MKLTERLTWVPDTIVIGMPYGTGSSPYDGPKSGWRRLPGRMWESQSADRAATGSFEMSAFQ